MAISAIASAEKGPSVPTTEALEEGDSYNGTSRQEFVRRALTEFIGSRLSQRAVERGYGLNKDDSLVFVGNDGDTETACVYFTISDGEKLGSNELPGLTGGDEGTVEFGHYIWSSDDDERNHTVRQEAPRDVLSGVHTDAVQADSASATELIRESQHLIDSVGIVDGNGSGRDATRTVENVSIDVAASDVTRTTEVIENRTGPTPSDTGCPSSFTSALTSLVGCSGGRVVCVGLFAGPASAVVACAACGACSLVRLCCVGSLTPESYYSLFASLRYTTDP